MFKAGVGSSDIYSLVSLSLMLHKNHLPSL